MKLSLLLTLIPTFAFAAEIPQPKPTKGDEPLAKEFSAAKAGAATRANKQHITKRRR